ncbi:hypothetical protein ACTWP4_18645 [Gracilibacillus sp. D59]|uniref:hypothetical protein n=1 Tax=Gracilibacillus sp. D59 TaxID=3457434 RepID=UPI003FCD6280
MAQVPKKIGHGASNIPDLNDILQDGVDDNTNLRNALIALLQKLDADAGTASDYESSLTPAPLKNTKE